MKEESFHDLPDDRFRERFGELTGEEFSKLRDRLLDDEVEPENDLQVHEVLKKTASAPNGAAPPLPESVRRSFESARLSAENVIGEADVDATPKHDESEGSGTSPSGRWHSMAVITGGLAAATAIAVAFVTYIRPVATVLSITYADEVTLLTPGDKTGFLEPIFTWRSGNGGVVDVRVLASNGEAVASVDRAFSPLRWSALEARSPLRSGEAYELQISTPEGLVSTRSFETGEGAVGAPAPEESLDAIIRQCEELIAANRPADAWMLWGELTSAQKADPRMQELKDRILTVIAS